MTDREKAIVMAYTGKCMLTGDKLHIFYKYVEEIMGRPVYTHEMGIKAVDDEIREKSKADFVALCREQEANTGEWIACSDRLPEEGEEVLVWYEYLRYGEHGCMYQTYGIGYQYGGHWAGSVSGEKARCIAWMPLPEPPEHTKPKASKEFKVGEKIPPEEWQKAMSVTEIIEEVRERMCIDYCRHSHDWDYEKQGEISESEICASCPLNRL